MLSVSPPLYAWRLGVQTVAGTASRGHGVFRERERAVRRGFCGVLLAGSCWISGWRCERRAGPRRMRSGVWISVRYETGPELEVAGN